MVQFTTSFKLALSCLGLSLLVLATQPGSITRATLGKLARDAAEQGHHYAAPGKDDSRSPCPALNTLANHGYLPRNGRDIGPFDLVYALQSAYALDFTLSHLLAIGGFFLVHHDSMTSLPTPPPALGADPAGFMKAVLAGAEGALSPAGLEAQARDVIHWADAYARHRTMDLHRIGLHGRIEHDASITHDDAPHATSEFARVQSNHTLFAAFMEDAPGAHVGLSDVGTARVRREAESAAAGRAIDVLHAFIARGEAALVIGIFGQTAPGAPANVSHAGAHWDWAGLGVPKDVMRTFWLEERLPAGWAPARITSIKSTQMGNALVGARMDALRAEPALRRNATAQVVFASH